MTDETTPDDDTTVTRRRRVPSVGKVDASSVRTAVARLLWAVCVLFACILAVAVLLLALDANPDNALVEWVGHRSDDVDLGFFALDNPIKEFDDETGTALFNYGIAAIVWLAVGRLLDRVVRP